MSKVDDSKKSNTQKAVDARPPFDGPHKPGAKRPSAEGADGAPAYVVAVTKQEKSPEDMALEKTHSTYNPEEMRSKARTLMNSGNISREQRQVLGEILGPDKEK